MNHANQTVDQPGESGQPFGAQSTPAHIDRYRIERVLGRGGFGLVYLAHDDQLRRQVAIKVPHPERVSIPENAEAYLAEARTVANLDHPHIVPVYDVGGTADCPCYVVAKYIDGTDLATRLRESRPSIDETVGLLATVAEALHYAHKLGLVHRDIKPGNILLDKSGKAFVADFGLALREQDMGQGPRYAGTPAYMSPEQAGGEGHRVDGRSDIFSLGVVLYEVLTGRRPFRAESHDELLHQIASQEARPPRQIDDTIPKELERICLKALAKRASDRYTTAKDLADDLRHFLAEASAAEKSAVTGRERHEAEAATPLPSPVPTPAEQQAVKIVPKGLRSFDAGDADFFLDLLPGARDRDGLPESIRFWKKRIEATDADSSFSVGLIYAPSGCGKSSLVKAGLLPRLAKSVRVVYVEATGEETEARLRKGLRRQVPDLPGNLGVVESLAALRLGRFLEPSQKVLLVLDQFEQWLHAKRMEENTELVQALRQCDGGRLQSIVMVRDDFWLAVSRFMQALEIRIVEGENSRLVDLFDPRHATKVLTAFGRAFGALPEKELTKDQHAFLDQAVAGLAQDGKVVSVRLALFAEMVKGKPWTPATLRDVGGTEGVGVTFLEETFAASTAPPQHRLHQKAAQGVLRALLPDSGSDIKGHMRSQQELLNVSGYASRPKDIDDLLRILDTEIRLITPADPEGKEDAEPSTIQAGAKYYQLTHDYLVPSLREWLTRKQKETRRGRAELLLADRAAVWNGRPENRQLPSLWQWASIRFWTRKRNWTAPQRKMMGRANRYHLTRALVAAVFLTAGTCIGVAVWNRVEEDRNRTEAAGLVQTLANADIAKVPDLIEKLTPYRVWADPLLRDEFDGGADGSPQKLHAALALLGKDPSYGDYAYRRLLDASPGEIEVLAAALANDAPALKDGLWQTVQQPHRDKEHQRLRAACALAQYDAADAPRWRQAAPAVADDLLAAVQKNPSDYPALVKLLTPVGTALVEPLAVVFRDPKRAEAERQLATSLLVTFAASDAATLADLLMDADAKAFAALFPAVKEHGGRAVAVLAAEIHKRPASDLGKKVFDAKGTISDSDAKVKTSQGLLPAQRYEVALKVGKLYRLTMDSRDLDSFLVVHDKNGKELAFDDDSGGDLNSLILFSPPADGTYTVYAAALEKTGAFVLTVVETTAGDGGKERLAQRQANAAVAQVRLGEAERAWPVLKHNAEPRARSYLIHRLAPMGADAAAVVRRLGEEPDLSVRRALILSLGEFSDAAVASEKESLVPKLRSMLEDPDPGLRGAAEWLLRKWQRLAPGAKTAEQLAAERDAQIASIGAALVRGEKQPRWYVNGQGQTMVVIPGPVSFDMGSPATEGERFGGPTGPNEILHKKTIGRSFAIAAKEVSVAEFRRFRANHAYMLQYSPTEDCPVNSLSWHDAAAYCNWLSKGEGLPECYEINPKGQVAKLKGNYLSLGGYRLPTEAEWEYACRASAATSRYYGDTPDLLGKYAWYMGNSGDARMLVPGSLMPNDLGLFDMLGNALEWCHDLALLYKGNEDKENPNDEKFVGNDDNNRRVLRGGSFDPQARNVRCADRYTYAPATRNYYFGFRVARTFPLDSFIPLPPTPKGSQK